MARSPRISAELPQLDRADDPRGGSVAWALLAVTIALIVGIGLALAWFW